MMRRDETYSYIWRAAMGEIGYAHDYAWPREMFIEDAGHSRRQRSGEIVFSNVRVVR